MNERLFQQAEQIFKPMTDMMALNAKTFEALAEKQTALMSDMWNDGLSYARNLSDKQDVESFYTSQKDYWETVNQKFNSTAQDAYKLLTEAQERMGELMQDSISAVDVPGSEPFKQAAHTAQSSAKSAAKSATKTAQKTQSQASKGASTAASKAG